MLFLLYHIYWAAFCVSIILRKFGVSFHFHADDNQIYLPIKRNDPSALLTLLSCLDEVKLWLSNNFLTLRVLGSIAWSEPEFVCSPLPPAGLRSYYFIWVRTAVRLRQVSNFLPRCLVTTAREKAAKCIRCSLRFYIFTF